MFQLISIFTTITGLFTLLDLFVEKDAKAKVAEYVFGFGNANLAGFEYNTINALLSPLKVDGRVSYKRVLFRYSGVIAILITAISFFSLFLLPEPEEAESIFRRTFNVIVNIPIMVLIFWPFDCWSLWVTNKVFSEKKSSSLFSFIGRVLIDVLITLMPLVIASIGLYFLFNPIVLIPEDTSELTIAAWISTWAFAFIFFNVIGSLLVTAVQLLTLTLGVLLRTVLRLTKLNQHVAMVSSVHEFPFTFIGLVMGVIGAVTTAVVT